MTDKERKEIFSKNLMRILTNNSKTQIEVANDIGVSQQTFNTWCRGVAIPRMGKIQLLADYFHIGMSELIEPYGQDESIDPYYNSEEYLNSITDDEKYLIETYRDLTPDSKEKVTEYAEFLMVKENKQENTPVLSINPPRNNAFAARKLTKSSSKLLRRRKNGAG